jgi:hypothetical protein
MVIRFSFGMIAETSHLSAHMVIITITYDMNDSSLEVKYHTTYSQGSYLDGGSHFSPLG